MKSFSVRELKDDPAAALRAAREQPAVVLNEDVPEAMLVHLDDPSMGDADGRRALALGLYRLGGLSLGHAGTPFGTSCGGIHGGGIEMRHLRSRLHGGNPSPGGTSRRSLAPELLVADDASSLIGLAKADAFELPRGLFENPGGRRHGVWGRGLSGAGVFHGGYRRTRVTPMLRRPASTSKDSNSLRLSITGKSSFCGSGAK